MIRFWNAAEAACDPEGWRVLLDGRPVRLPDGPPLLLAHRAMAEAVAAEWREAGGGKGGEMSYADVPLTRLAGTAQIRVAPAAEPVALELARYAETDLLCYRAAHPADLVRRQVLHWDPWLDWAAATHGARLHATTGIGHRAQDPAALAALAGAVAALDVPSLAALGIAVPLLGSLVLGLALAEGAIDAATAHAVSLVDELFQEAAWGADDEALARRARVAADLDLAGRFLTLSRIGDAAA